MDFDLNKTDIEDTIDRIIDQLKTLHQSTNIAFFREEYRRIAEWQFTMDEETRNALNIKKTKFDPSGAE